MASPEKFTYETLENGHTVPIDENGMVVLPPETESIPQQVQPSSFDFKLEISGHATMPEIHNLMQGSGIVPNAVARPAQPDYYQQPYASSDQPVTEQIQPQYDSFPYEGKGLALSVQQELERRDQEELARQPRMSEPRFIEPQAPSRTVLPEVITKKKVRWIPFLGSMAVLSAVAAGPFIHAHEAGRAAAEECGPVNVGCATEHFVKDSAKNIFNFKPSQEKK